MAGFPLSIIPHTWVCWPQWFFQRWETELCNLWTLCEHKEFSGWWKDVNNKNLIICNASCMPRYPVILFFLNNLANLWIHSAQFSSLGTVVDILYPSPSRSNILFNLSAWVPVPAHFEKTSTNNVSLLPMTHKILEYFKKRSCSADLPQSDKRSGTRRRAIMFNVCLLWEEALHTILGRAKSSSK